jgi:signal transduction histidine kinase
MREYLSRLLHPRYEVILASDGKSALAAIEGRLPQVVLSDVMMPRLDGLNLVSRLREHPRTRAIPIVLLSARTGEEATLDGLGRGADDYVVKPFSARELVARIDTHLELARIRADVGQLKLKDEFMTIVSHELVTPLTSMKLVFQFVRERLRGIGSPEAELLSRLDRALARMERLVEDLLTSSRLEQRAEPKLAIADTSLGPLVSQAAEEQSAASGRPVIVELPAGGEAICAPVDPDAVGHVVGNLVGNALKFSAPETAVRVQLSRAGDEAIIAVSDQGQGIPPSEHARLFDRYYRVPYIAVRSGSKVGFGLGLYISKAIVERHHGRIWVESTVGRGSTFFVALPLATQ